jgi:hypothetical protein
MPRRPDIRGQRHGDRHHFSHIFFHVKMVYTQIPLIPWKNMEKMFIIYLNGIEKMAIAAMGMVMIVAGSSEIQWAQQPTSP